MARNSVRVAAPDEDGRAELRVIVVLGCRPVWTPHARLTGALGRRVRTAVEHAERSGTRPASGLPSGAYRWVAAGGRTWGGVVEADAIRDELVHAGIPTAHVLRERCSLTTHDNARFTAELLHRLGVQRITLVTCEWHLPRAAALFHRQGLTVERVGAPTPDVAPVARWYRTGHEWVSTRLGFAAGSPA